MVKDFGDLNCSVARTLEVVGERWSLLILRDALYGVRRFDDFQQGLGIARNILTDRLSKLVGHGVLEKRQYEEKPPRYEYRLTDKGRELVPVLLAMMRWGDKWEAGPDGPPVTIVHKDCGHDSNPVLVCGHCREELHGRNIYPDPLPEAVLNRMRATA